MPVVLAGDYNVIPTELDVYKPERWVDDALFRPEMREAFPRLVAQGWTDALRTLHPGRTHLHVLGLFPECLGTRCRACGSIICCSARRRAERLVAAGVDREVRGWEKASDHAPAWIELSDSGQRITAAGAAPEESSIGLTLHSIEAAKPGGGDTEIGDGVGDVGGVPEHDRR